jgi:signal transduction histidine kinase
VGAELAVYRVVQEALTNAIKHAAGRRTVVRVGHEPGLVDIEVTTTGAILAGTGETEPASPAAPGGLQPAAGRGLAGLHERVGMLGGEFMAAPQPGGGFRVHARIPSRSGP